MMPSIKWGLSWVEWSASAWLNLTNWSTASFPTKASPTNRTRSVYFGQSSHEGFHSNSRRILPITLLIQLHHSFPSMILRRMKRSQMSSVSTKLLHRTSTKSIASCDQNSQIILNQPKSDLNTKKKKKLNSPLIEHFSINFITLAKFVDFPTPFTPQNVMTYGRCKRWVSMTSRKMLILLLGDKIWTSALSRVDRTVEATVVKVPKTRPSSSAATESHNLCAISMATFLPGIFFLMQKSLLCINIGIKDLILCIQIQFLELNEFLRLKYGFYGLYLYGFIGNIIEASGVVSARFTEIQILAVLRFATIFPNSTLFALLIRLRTFTARKFRLILWNFLISNLQINKRNSN
uniref:Uncharacterized protein n=1 Tax=Strigamia maritima TaxID=126957 RepID=T1JHN1_STRMM